MISFRPSFGAQHNATKPKFGLTQDEAKPYINQQVRVKHPPGGEATGTLLGFNERNETHIIGKYTFPDKRTTLKDPLEVTPKRLIGPEQPGA